MDNPLETEREEKELEPELFIPAENRPNVTDAVHEAWQVAALLEEWEAEASNETMEDTIAVDTSAERG